MVVFIFRTQASQQMKSGTAKRAEIMCAGGCKQQLAFDCRCKEKERHGLMKTKKKKTLGAYMTIEASLIIPMVIGILVSLVFLAFFLYNRCVLTQDMYILCLRGSTFTNADEGYGEVSYIELSRREAKLAHFYIESRLDYARYPFFTLTSDDIEVRQADVLLSQVYAKLKVKGISKSFFGKDFPFEHTAFSVISNPVVEIRQARRKENKEE